MEKFFYTTNTPHQWSSGPSIHYFDPETWAEIGSLEEAKALAEKHTVGHPGEGRWVKTTYGIEYSDE